MPSAPKILWICSERRSTCVAMPRARSCVHGARECARRGVGAERETGAHRRAKPEGGGHKARVENKQRGEENKKEGARATRGRRKEEKKVETQQDGDRKSAKCKARQL